MNNRIQELAEQAGLGIIFHLEEMGVDGETELWKFAELIVKDCVSICELNGQSYKHSFTPAKAKLAESTSVYCGTLIKKHFGVEE